jgi:hypothetical protein
MNKWNYIGQGSAFDGDMDFTEKIINYVEVGKVDDIDAVYFYYRSSIASYWVKLEEIFDTDIYVRENFATIVPEYPENYKKQEAVNLNLKRIFEDIKKKIQPKKDFYKEILDKKINDLQLNYEILRNNITEKGRFYLIRQVFNIFYYLSNLSCGISPAKELMESNRLYIDGLGMERSVDLDNDINMKQIYIFPLTNETGWFSYNSYMYALSRGLHIVGFPSGISTYDGTYGCPVNFMIHDITHIRFMVDNIINKKVYEELMNRIKMSERIVRPLEFEKEIKFYELPWTYKLSRYYDSIMKGNYTRSLKEILIFTLWGILHENFLSSFDLETIDLKMEKVRFIPNDPDEYTFFGLHLTKEQEDEAFEIASIILSEESFDQLWCMKASLEGRYLGKNWYEKFKQLEAEGVSKQERLRLCKVRKPTQITQDHYHANLAIIYGINFFMKYFI